MTADWSAWCWPLPVWKGREPVISNPFAPPKHLGADLMYRRPNPGEPELPWKTKLFEVWPDVPVLCCGPGHVWSAGWVEDRYITIVDHHQVPGYGPLASMYVHMSSVNPQFSRRAAVKAGDVLGYVGHTGTNVSHLHFALSNDPKRKWHVNPATLLGKWRKPRAWPQRQSRSGSGALIALALIVLLEE